MQTNFSPAQLTDSDMARSEMVLRKCVHCGFCIATCPTYVLLGDELDSPRGRIYLIKDMLENERVPDASTVKHIDRCLSCLSCMTTCPSSVHYMHLIDHARAYVEKHYARPWDEKALRWLLVKVLPSPTLFRLALFGAKLTKPFASILPHKLRTMVQFAPDQLPSPSPNDRPQVFPALGTRRFRVALMTGCAQRALNTDINDATIRLLTRLGCDVVVAKGAGCCGALGHHMGKVNESHRAAAANIRAWIAELDGAGLDAIVINTSGCGTTVKDYGHMFRDDPLASDAARLAALTKDVSELVLSIGLPSPKLTVGLRVAYHSACSLQHGQQIKTAPKELLTAAGFTVVEPKEPHICCGSAGTYNLLQPELSGKLKERKVKNLMATQPQVIAAGNIGCMMQISSAATVPVVHTVELLDWATGGPQPPALSRRGMAL